MPSALVAVGGIGVIVVIYLVIAFFAGLAPFGDGSDSDNGDGAAATATVPLGTPEPTPDRGLDLDIVARGGCTWAPASEAGLVATVDLVYAVRNSVGRYLGAIDVEATGNLAPWSATFNTDPETETDDDVEWSEIYATNRRYFATTAEIGVEAGDMGNPANVVLQVDPTNKITELDETNNSVTVVIELPAEAPTDVGGEPVDCHPPLPTPVPPTPTP